MSLSEPVVCLLIRYLSVVRVRKGACVSYRLNRQTQMGLIINLAVSQNGQSGLILKRISGRTTVVRYLIHRQKAAATPVD